MRNRASSESENEPNVYTNNNHVLEVFFYSPSVKLLHLSIDNIITVVFGIWRFVIYKYTAL